jgi:competence protein ComEC
MHAAIAPTPSNAAEPVTTAANRPIAIGRDPPALAALRYQPLVIVLAAVCAGIVCDRWLPQPATAWCVVSAASLAGWIVLALLARRGTWATPRLSTCVLCVAIAALAAARHHIHWNLYGADELSRAADEEPRPVAVDALALTGPRRIPKPVADPLQPMERGERTRLQVRFIAVRDGALWHPASGQAILMVEGELEGVHSGDRLRIFGQLTASQPPKNPGDLDFALYARAERRLSFVRAESPECVQPVQPGSVLTVRRLFEEARSRCDSRLHDLVDERSRLAAALMLGAREQLDPDQTDAFVRTGTIHVLAISGMHIAILASSLFFALRWGLLRRRLALVAVMAATVLYTILTDAEPSAVRAMILVVLICGALAVGRPAAVFNWWAAGGLVVLAINPADLFRAGPQLSFLAVAVMSWFAPRWAAWQRLDPLERLIAQTRPWPQRVARGCGLWTGRALLVSAAIWLVTGPLVMARFHLLSPVAMLLGPVLIFPSAVALMSGFGVLVFGWIEPLGRLFGWLCGQSLDCTQRIVGCASQTPGSYFWLPAPAEWRLAAFYLGLIAWSLWPAAHSQRPLRLAAAGVLGAIGFLPGWWFQPPPQQLECTFLSVGHGCCVVVRFPDGQTLMYDAGRLGTPKVGARSIAGYLWSQGVRRIDALVISHADVDHYNALPDLAEQFAIGRVYVSPQMFRDDVEPLRLLRAAIDTSGAELCTIAAGDDLRPHPDCLLRVLHPPMQGVAGSDNANSIVLVVEHAGRRIILPGDLESAGMQSVLKEPRSDCDIALAPHHGSTRSNPPGFSAWCTPEFVVISGGHEERLDSVRNAYEAGGARVLHTARGAVKFSVGSQQVDVVQWRRGQWRAIDDLAGD